MDAGTIVHRYPICWRCKTPLVFRVVDDWFIAADEIRQPMLDANATVEWTPPQYGKRMDDWLRNMGDWNISRKRYFGLPLPFYECECGDLNVIGSRAELEARAVSGLDDLQELHRPWIDGVRIRCEQCGREVERIPEVGDAWLDAGIVNFSTLGWRNPEWKEHGYATGASAGLSGADLPDHAYWEEWFPANWVSEMREQIRLWFYSQCFMAVTLDGRSPYQRVLTYEKVFDEKRQADAQVDRQLDRAERRARPDGCRRRALALLRAGAESAAALRLRPRRRGEAPPAHVLELRLVLLDVRVDREVRSERCIGRAAAARPLARVADRAARARYDRRVRALLDAGRRDGVRVVHGGSLELVHPPLAAPLLGRRHRSARARSTTRSLRRFG